MESLLSECKELINKLRAKPIVNFRQPLNYSRVIDELPDFLKLQLLKTVQPKDERWSIISPLVLKEFAHIHADPSDPEIVRKLRLTYTFPGDELGNDLLKVPGGTQRSCPFWANETPQSSHDFVSFLVRKSCERRAQYARETGSTKIPALDSCVTLLLGDKGAGKTIFINALFSILNEFLEDNKCIWIRADLVNAPRHLDVQQLLRYQFLHVIAKYYDRKSPLAVGKKLSFDLSGNNHGLYECIADRDPSLTKEKFPNWVEMQLQLLRDKKQPRDANPALFLGLQEYLLRYEKVGIISIVDGLDRLDGTEEAEEIFRKRVREVTEEVMSGNSDPAAYIVVMRYRSYMQADIMKQNSYLDPAICGIVPVSASAIVANRIDYFGTKPLPSDVLGKVHGESEQQAREIVKSKLHEMVALISYTISREVAGEKENVRGSGLNLLRDLFNSNMRSFMRALTRTIEYLITHGQVSWDESDDVSRVKYYKVVEALLLGNKLYFLPKYSYRTHDMLKVVTVKGELYFPCLLHHPFLPGQSYKVSHLLVKVRLCQYLKIRRGNSTESTVDFLVDHFSYEKKIIVSALEELLEDGLVAYKRDYAQIKIDSLETTKSGQLILDNLLYDLAYLHLAFQSSPLPWTIIEKTSLKPCPREDNLPEWLTSQCLGVVTLVRLIDAIERKEEESFHRAAKSKEEAYQFRFFWGHDLRISPRLWRQSIELLKNSMASYDNATLVKIRKQLGPILSSSPLET